MKFPPLIALAVLFSSAQAQPVPAPTIPPTTPPAFPAGFGGPPGATLANQLVTQADKDGDRMLTRAEFIGLAAKWFARLDADGAARVAREEFVLRFASLLVTPGQEPLPGRRGGAGGGLVSGTGALRAATAGNALGLFALVDLNRDAVLESAELERALGRLFDAWDANHDGRLESAELARALLAALPRTNMGAGTGREPQERRTDLPEPPPSPMLDPAAALKTIQVAEGFRVELAASEPMIEDPVAMTFDADGRAYVVEMRAFMRDIDGKGEREPTCRISRLEDTDGDGRFDRATRFVDGLIVPRSVAAVAGGILYVSDYKLFFAHDTDGDGRADITELVDADYGRGNVEHAANGLFRALDNWIYNAGSPFRYRLVGGTLVRQATEPRGQWGMAQDNLGRLIYNVNNSQLMGDFAPPNYMGRNAHHPGTAGVNLFVATDQSVFPIHMTTAINRGYAPGVLDGAGRAYVFASSCGPTIYRGDNFPAEFVGDAFVADPALNLIKRSIVSDKNLTLTSRFAYPDREFIASADERFRPATLYNGPDGALWFVDFYRGIAQYGQFMTAYLRKDTLARSLDQGLGRGRIYRVLSTARQPAAPLALSRETSAQLVARLAHPNGWVRDTVQRLLVERADHGVAPALTKLAADTSADSLARIHALWTLEGLFTELPAATRSGNDTGKAPRLHVAEAAFAFEVPALPYATLDAILATAADRDPKVQVAALRVAESLTTGNATGRATLQAAIARLAEPAARAPAETLFQAVLTAGNLPKPAALPLLARLATGTAEHFLIREGLLSGLQDWELPFLQLLLADPAWRERAAGRAGLLHALAAAIGRERDPTKVGLLRTLTDALSSKSDWRHAALTDGLASIPAPRTPADTTGPRVLTDGEKSRQAAGATLYQQLCAGCHGLAGQGTVPLAPPLANSEWVTGAEARLIRILLHGLTGPVRVDGTDYAPPTVLPEMPALGSLDDTQLAAVLTYLRGAWGHAAAPIAPARIAAERETTRSRAGPWTAAELEAVK